MAKAKFGAIVTDVRGKLGGHVFQGNGMVTSIRTGYSGKGGMKQRASWYYGLNHTIHQNWLALSNDDKQAWRLLARRYPIKDNFGNANYLTGENLHRRNYTALLSSGQVGTINPLVAIGDLPSSQLEFVTFDFTRQRIDLQFVNDRFSDAIIIYALPVLKYGLSIQALKLPWLYGENDETPNDRLLWDAFFIKYPQTIINDPVQFGVVQVNKYGFQSFVKTTYATYL